MRVKISDLRAQLAESIKRRDRLEEANLALGAKVEQQDRQIQGWKKLEQDFIESEREMRKVRDLVLRFPGFMRMHDFVTTSMTVQPSLSVQLAHILGFVNAQLHFDQPPRAAHGFRTEIPGRFTEFQEDNE